VAHLVQERGERTGVAMAGREIEVRLALGGQLVLGVELVVGDPEETP